MGGVRGTVAQCVGIRSNFDGSESWVEIPESSLTSRQRQLLNQELPAGQWRQRMSCRCGPMERPAPALECEQRRLRAVAGPVRCLRARVGNGCNHLPATARGIGLTSTRLSERTVLRLSVQNSGMYRIDRAWMIDAGFDPDTIDPRNVHVFGNGGAAADGQFEGPTPGSAFRRR